MMVCSLSSVSGQNISFNTEEEESMNRINRKNIPPEKIFINRTMDDCETLPSGIDGTFQSCDNANFNNFFNGNVTCGGWLNESYSADTWKLPITNAGAGNFMNINIPNSNNGGVFAAGLAAIIGRTPPWIESFKAQITNLVPGEGYRVEFEQINLCNLAYTNTSVRWKVVFGSQTSYSPSILTASNPQWSNVSLNFVATATTQTLIFEASSEMISPAIPNNGYVYAGIDGITIKRSSLCPPEEACINCTSFDLIKKEKYLISGWVKEEDTRNPQAQYKNYSKAFISVTFKDVSGAIIGAEENFYASGEIIDGWQRIIGEFRVPENVDDMLIELNNIDASKMAYFDDIRVLPTKGNMKSFVYDQETQRLMAELDENNYSTFYEYDLEGGLVRVKKETEKGVFTIQETRSGNKKSAN